MTRATSFTTLRTLGQEGRNKQRGAATLLVTLVLVLAMSLGAFFLNRNLTLGQRLAANQVQAAQAFEAAEAGLDWATAQLNNPQKIGLDCQASSAASAQTFRASRVAFDAKSGLHTPRTWNDASQVMPLQAVCVRSAEQSGGWSCSCPASGHPVVVNRAAPATATATATSTELATTTAAAAFTVTFLATSVPGQLRVIAQGCTSYAGACQPGSLSQADATAQVQQLVALVSGLASAPVAALTVRGDVSTHAALGLHRGNHASTGAAVHSGGKLEAPNARIGAAAGGVSTVAVIEHDLGLSGVNEARFFSRLFGTDAATWSAQPMMQKLVCKDNCNAALLDAFAATSGTVQLWVDGEFTLTAPLTVGSAARPVLLLVNGTATLNGAVRIHGMLHAARVQWNDDGSGAGRVTGAVTSASDYSGSGAPDLVFDAAALRLLQTNSGSFTRIAGSWKDF